MAQRSLKIYREDSHAKHTLRAAFEEFLLPTLSRNCSAAHIAQFRTSLSHWERLTDDPAVEAIEDSHLQNFADSLLAWHLAHGFLGNTNTAKNLNYLSAILRACCKRGTSNKRGQPAGRHIIEDLPTAIPPAKDRRKKRIADVLEISAAYEACEVAAWPRSRRRSLWDGPVQLWRLLYVLDYTYGPRTEDLLGLRWENIRWDPGCPAEDISRLDWPHGWLVYTPPKTRRHKPEPLHLPLTEVARKHLEELRPSAKPKGPIFAFPKNKRALYGTNAAIWERAGVQAPYTFQELRKTCSTAWNDLRPKLGEHVTGHAARGVNAVHYDTELRRLCREAPKLAQPPAFLAAVGIDPARPSAKAELAARLGTFSEETARLILSLADNMPA